MLKVNHMTLYLDGTRSTPKTFNFFAMHCITNFTPIFLGEDFGGMLENYLLRFKLEGE
jgi:hypothetical protein